MFQAAQMMRKPAGMTSRNYGTYLDGIRQVRRKQMPYSTAYGANIYDSIRSMTPANKPDIGSILGSFMQGVGSVPASGVFSQQLSATQAAGMNAMRGQAAQSNLLPSQGMTMGGGAMISGSNSMPSNVTAANNMDMLRATSQQQAADNAAKNHHLNIMRMASQSAPTPAAVYGPPSPAGTPAAAVYSPAATPAPTATMNTLAAAVPAAKPRRLNTTQYVMKQIGAKIGR